MPAEMILKIWDVEHGACAMLAPRDPAGVLGKLAMIDCSDAVHFRPSAFIREFLGRSRLDYLFVTNADLDQLSDLEGFWENDVVIASSTRNPTPSPDELRSIKLQGGPLAADVERFLDIHQSYNRLYSNRSTST